MPKVRDNYSVALGRGQLVISISRGGRAAKWPSGAPRGVQHASSRNFSFVTATVPFSAVPPSANEVENGARWPGSQDLGNIMSLH